jgi:hypothetical protein
MSLGPGPRAAPKPLALGPAPLTSCLLACAALRGALRGRRGRRPAASPYRAVNPSGGAARPLPAPPRCAARGAPRDARGAALALDPGALSPLALAEPACRNAPHFRRRPQLARRAQGVVPGRVCCLSAGQPNRVGEALRVGGGGAASATGVLSGGGRGVRAGGDCGRGEGLGEGRAVARLRGRARAGGRACMSPTSALTRCLCAAFASEAGARRAGALWHAGGRRGTLWPQFPAAPSARPRRAPDIRQTPVVLVPAPTPLYRPTRP